MPPMMPPMMPQMPMPFGAPCMPTPFNPCPPKKAAAKKPAAKKPAAAPQAPKPVVLQGFASPMHSGFVLPAPPPPYIAPPPIVQFTGASPCYPGIPGPCSKRAPIRRPAKGKAKKPVAKTVTPVQANQQSFGAWRS